MAIEKTVNRRLPAFVIIGAQKAGTTWLGYRLFQQPGIFMPRPLEVHFFDRKDNYAKGLDWYASRFAGASETAVVGEKTPDYFWTTRPEGRGPNDIPERMHKALPDARLIVILRNPVKRAISALNHVVRARELSPFVSADAVLTESLDPKKDRFGLIDRGHYLKHLQRFLTCYPRERIHVLLFEETIIKSPQQTIERVMSFLGRQACASIQLPSRPENRRMNSRVGLLLNYYAPALTPVIAALDRSLPAAPEIAPSPNCLKQLYDHFAPHNEALFSFLGARSTAWTVDAGKLERIEDGCRLSAAG
jgi:hypothetical protein